MFLLCVRVLGLGLRVELSGSKFLGFLFVLVGACSFVVAFIACFPLGL